MQTVLVGLFSNALLIHIQKILKRIGNLYPQIYDIENLRKAFRNAKKGKGWYEEVKIIEADLDYYLYKLQDMLIHKTYHTSEYEIFYKKEGNKTRKIYKLPFFPDRIAQWAILQVIEPYIIKTLIADTYSAIPKRGIHYGLNRIKHDMQTDKENCQFCLKLDFRHYYQSINHEILKQKYRKLFKDKDLLWLLDEIISSVNTCEEDDLYEIYVILLEEDIDEETGEPIGNYLSQYSGNFYLSDFDHWLKEQKHVKYYYRYMDDIVIFGRTKEELRELLQEIRIYVKDNLKLRLKDNYQIFPTYVRGVDFLGYRLFDGYILLRKSTCQNFKRKMNHIKEKIDRGGELNYSEYCSINSYMGWLKHCDSFRLQQKYIKPLIPYTTLYYNTHIKKEVSQYDNVA